jgi:arginine decarboxylase-like protein
MCERETLVHFTVRSEARRQILTKYIFNVSIFAECVTIWQLSQNFLVFWFDGDN